VAEFAGGCGWSSIYQFGSTLGRVLQSKLPIWLALQVHVEKPMTFSSGLQAIVEDLGWLTDKPEVIPR
jgi:hypothetical protein